MSVVYGIKAGQFIKVGITKDLPRRLRQMQLFNPYPPEVVFELQVREARWVEMRMHEELRADAIGREWFQTTPAKVRAAADVAMKKLAKVRDEWKARAAAAIERGDDIPVPPRRVVSALEHAMMMCDKRVIKELRKKGRKVSAGRP